MDLPTCFSPFQPKCSPKLPRSRINPSLWTCLPVFFRFNQSACLSCRGLGSILHCGPGYLGFFRSNQSARLSFRGLGSILHCGPGFFLFQPKCSPEFPRSRINPPLWTWLPGLCSIPISARLRSRINPPSWTWLSGFFPIPTKVLACVAEV